MQQRQQSTLGSGVRPYNVQRNVRIPRVRGIRHSVAPLARSIGIFQMTIKSSFSLPDYGFKSLQVLEAIAMDYDL
jgi:hypothetical protein